MEMGDVVFKTLVSFREELRQSASPVVSAHKRMVDGLNMAHGDFSRAFHQFDRGIMQVDEMRKNGASAEEIESHMRRMQQELRTAIETFEKKVAAPNE